MWRSHFNSSIALMVSDSINSRIKLTETNMFTLNLSQIIAEKSCQFSTNPI